MKQLQRALAKRTALLRRANPHKIGYPIPSIVLLACLFTPFCWPQQYQRQVGMAWDFTTAPDTLGWSPISPLSGFGLRNGALTFTATSKVAIFYSPSISVATAALQRVEIVMSSDTGGAAKVFWAPATSGVYGGFQPGDENDFVLVGDSRFHSYVLPIDTSSANNIYRLRLDVPEGATVAIKSVALTSLTEPAGSGVSPSWQFSGNNDALGWMLFQGTADTGAKSPGPTRRLKRVPRPWLADAPESDRKLTGSRSPCRSSS